MLSAGAAASAATVKGLTTPAGRSPVHAAGLSGLAPTDSRDGVIEGAGKPIPLGVACFAVTAALAVSSRPGGSGVRGEGGSSRGAARASVKNVLEPSVLPVGRKELGDSGGRALPGIPSGDDIDETPDVRRSDVDTLRRTPLTLLRPLAALASLRTTLHSDLAHNRQERPHHSQMTRAIL